LWSKGAAI